MRARKDMQMLLAWLRKDRSLCCRKLHKAGAKSCLVLSIGERDVVDANHCIAATVYKPLRLFIYTNSR